MTKLAMDVNSNAIQAIFPGVVQTVSVTAAAAPTTNGFAAATTIVRIVCSQNCHYTVGSPPIAATTSDSYLPAGVVEFVSVGPGNKISFIRNSADGTAWVTEGA